MVLVVVVAVEVGGGGAGGRREMPALLRESDDKMSLTPTISISTLYETKNPAPLNYVWGPALPFELSS